MRIPYNKPFIIGKELEYIRQAVESGKISGDGDFTKKCHDFFERTYGFKKVLLTTSCTDALEMAAILMDIGPGDEVIMPSYTFVSTANAFVLRGAQVVFADCEPERPNIAAASFEPLITGRTKAIVAVHYAGMSCDMDRILELAGKYGLLVIEDCAQAIGSTYKGRPLGTFGQFAAFSFHETKNIISGEGGMLAINDERYFRRAEIIREKGTNRSAFFRGEADKYNWVDIGSSFLPSEIISAFLFAQLENLDRIQERRVQLWNTYYRELSPLADKKFFSLPDIPPYASNNGHIFYLICRSQEERGELIRHLAERSILAVFHYLPLHESPFYRNRHRGETLSNAQRFADLLLRLPLYYELSHDDQAYVISEIKKFYETR
ncbi:MAG: dTDP-4-amino-4,6-dideoxygalactose transaminase [Bacteroidota bacterium]